MEMFSADNDEQWSIIQSTIDNSDYYILILGHRYGSLTKDNISFTEKEFDYAKSIGLPIISFIRNRDFATKPSERDPEPSKAVQLAAFLEKVTNNSMCDFWETENQLGQKVAIALTKIFFKTPGIGWVKASQINSIETTEQLTKLIQENRELREEVEKLKSVKHNDTPIIDVQVNNSNEIVLKLSDSRFFQYKKITQAQIPKDLVGEISKTEIEDYNKSIEENYEEIEKYKTDYLLFDNIKNNASELTFTVSNNGKSKATDVYIDVQFPNEVIIFEKGDFRDIAKPISPDVLENPVERVMYRKKSWPKMPTFLQNAVGLDSQYLKALNVNKNFWIDKEKNIITIKIPKLTHTRTITIKDDIMIAPLKKGNYEFTITTVCDEFSAINKTTYNLKID